MGTQDATQLHHSHLFAPEHSTALLRDTRFTYTTPIHLLLQGYSTALFLEHKMPLIYTILTLSFKHNFYLLSPTSMENFLAYSSTLIEAADFSETSLHIYQTRQCYIPQNNEHHSHHSGNRFKIIIE